jgi:biofilm protein TabA
MRKYALAFFALFFVIVMVSAQTSVYTNSCNDKALKKVAMKWMKSGVWRNGFTMASPDKSVNAVEFYTQYQKNTNQWNALFKWLTTVDVLGLTKGKHPIEGTKLVASIEDDTNDYLSKRQSESHYHHIDFQYVVKGSERFGIIDHVTSTPNCGYKPDAIHYNYDVKRTKFYDSTPDRFFLFFPCDWHIAKVNTDKKDQNIRVVVVKVDYVD